MVTCPHGEVHPQACVDCMEGVPAERPAPQWVRVGKPFAAKFDGFCRLCRGRWEPDDLLQRWEQQERRGTGTVVLDTRYSHADCA